MSNSDAQIAHRRLRYGLRSLFLLFLVFVAIAGAYRYGYLQGRADGPVIPPSLDYGRIYHREYDVSDLVTPVGGKGGSTAHLSELTKHLKSWAAPESWDSVGGFGTMRPGEEGTSIVVEHTFAGHAALLEQLSRIRSQRRIARNKTLDYSLRQVATALEAERP